MLAKIHKAASPDDMSHLQPRAVSGGGTPEWGQAAAGDWGLQLVLVRLSDAFLYVGLVSILY